MRIAAALVAFLLALPLLCGALYFWVTACWNISLVGFSFLWTFPRWTAGGVLVTVVSLLFVWMGFSILSPKSDPPA